MTSLSDHLRVITNAAKRSRKAVLLTPCSKKIVSFLTVMLEKGYIESFKEIKDRKGGRVLVRLAGKLKKAKGISPCHSVRVSEMEGFKERNTPSKGIGYLVLTTTAGVIEHKEAIRRNVGGKVM